jgi:hypothetical protein
MIEVLILSAMLAGSADIPPPSMKTERILVYVTAITDIATTRQAIINGANEGNPLLTPFVGKTPSTLKLIGVKAVSILVTELAVKHFKGKKNYKMARFLLQWSAYLWAMASGSNLKFMFK